MSGGPYVGNKLPELLKAVWILANLITTKDREFNAAHDTPKVIFSPGIADRGTWGCCVEIVMNEGGLHSAWHGTIESNLQKVNERISELLGNGYRD